MKVLINTASGKLAARANININGSWMTKTLLEKNINQVLIHSLHRNKFQINIFF